jgi:hypothetical protein
MLRKDSLLRLTPHCDFTIWAGHCLSRSPESGRRAGFRSSSHFWVSLTSGWRERATPYPAEALATVRLRLGSGRVRGIRVATSEPESSERIWCYTRCRIIWQSAKASSVYQSHGTGGGGNDLGSGLAREGEVTFQVTMVKAQSSY